MPCGQAWEEEALLQGVQEGQEEQKEGLPLLQLLQEKLQHED